MQVRGRLRKKKQPNEESTKKWRLVDFSPIKDFIDYGLNKTLINLKLRRLVDIQTREELAKRGVERDWGKIMITIFVVIIVAVLAFVIVNQFIDYQGATRQTADMIIQLAQCQANLQTQATGGGGSVIRG